MATARQHGPCRRLEVTPRDKSLPQVAENFEAVVVIRKKVAAQMASFNPTSQRLEGREHSWERSGAQAGNTLKQGRDRISIQT